jgi:hypothetical protein
MTVVYTCYANTSPSFRPAYRGITAITQANLAEVTTSADHGYTTGLIVRLIIPPACGMPQADKMTGRITVTGTTTFTIDIDTSLFYPFAIPVPTSPHINVCPLVIPIGEDNNMLSEAERNVLP